jgi:sugar phosphate isomerase/epimerase
MLDGSRCSDRESISESVSVPALIAEAKRRTANRRMSERVAKGHIKPIPSLSPDELHVLDSGRFDEIELMLFDKRVEYAKMYEAFSRLYEKEARAYSVHLPNFSLNRPKGKQIGPFLRFVENVLEIFNPDVMVFHSLYGRPEDLIRNLQAISSELPSDKLLVIENLPKMGANLREATQVRGFFPELTRGLLQDNLGFCLDITHVPVPEGEDPTAEATKFIKAADNHLLHMHISDKRKDGSGAIPGGWEQHLPLGEGAIDWKALKTHLKATDYPGRVVLEYKLDSKHLLGQGAEFWSSL